MNKYSDVKKASILGIVGNIFLFIIKTIVGIISKSQAMIADSFNSASDVISSLMTFIGNKISSKQADDDHDLGHGKAEYIYSLMISVVMLILSYSVCKSSLIALINKDKFIFSYWLVIICIITIITKFILFIYSNKVAKKHDSILMKAGSKDHLNDCIITSINLISCLLALVDIYFVDSIIGILISIWIAITAIKIFKESYDVLMDKTLDIETKNEVCKVIEAHKEIIKINHFNATPVGYQYQISFTIFVDGNLSTFASHDIANSLEKEIIKKFPEIYLVVIHVNPEHVEN